MVVLKEFGTRVSMVVTILAKNLKKSARVAQFWVQALFACLDIDSCFNFENKKNKKKDNHKKIKQTSGEFQHCFCLYSKSWWQMWLNSL